MPKTAKYKWKNKYLIASIQTWWWFVWIDRFFSFYFSFVFEMANSLAETFMGFLRIWPFSWSTRCVLIIEIYLSIKFNSGKNEFHMHIWLVFSKTRQNIDSNQSFKTTATTIKNHGVKNWNISPWLRGKFFGLSFTLHIVQWRKSPATTCERNKTQQSAKKFFWSTFFYAHNVTFAFAYLFGWLWCGLSSYPAELQWFLVDFFSYFLHFRFRLPVFFYISVDNQCVDFDLRWLFFVGCSKLVGRLSYQIWICIYCSIKNHKLIKTKRLTE